MLSRYSSFTCALHLFVRNTLADVLHVRADVFNVGKAQQDFGEVFLANCGHSFGIGQKLNFQHLSLEVIHKPAKQKGIDGEEEGGGGRKETFTM